MMEIRSQAQQRSRRMTPPASVGPSARQKNERPCLMLQETGFRHEARLRRVPGRSPFHRPAQENGARSGVAPRLARCCAATAGDHQAGESVEIFGSRCRAGCGILAGTVLRGARKTTPLEECVRRLTRHYIIEHDPRGQGESVDRENRQVNLVRAIIQNPRPRLIRVTTMFSITRKSMSPACPASIDCPSQIVGKSRATHNEPSVSQRSLRRPQSRARRP